MPRTSGNAQCCGRVCQRYGATGLSRKRARSKSTPEGASQKRASSRDGPIVPRTHLDEGTSRRRLADLFHDWLVTSWSEHDFGLDGMVELTNPFSENVAQRINTGKKFSFQLKARSDEPRPDGSFALGVEVTHLRYWLNTTEFVMLVRYDIPTGKLHYRWIDDGLIGELTRKNPGWHAQSTVTLIFDNEHDLLPACLPKIAEYASKRKRITRGHLAPGQFFELREAIANERDEFAKLAAAISSDSIAKGVEQATKLLERSCYVVAIAGPSRAGKSTLLNVLVGQDVSPVDVLPTTAVPMMVIPSADEQIVVDFVSGARQVFPLSLPKVAEFVAQDQNPDNVKGVKQIRIGLVNATLERGVAFLDVPGLDDLSPTIQRESSVVLATANAVVYVVDGSPMSTGGFALRRPDLDHLIRLGGGADRLFFVVNKCDKLTESERAKLAGYLTTQFEKYDVASSMPTPALLISSGEAAASRAEEKSTDSVAPLEAALWDFLVNTQTTGIDALKASSSLLAGLVEDAETLLRSRLLTIEDVTKLRARASIARDVLANLRPQMNQEKQRILAGTTRRLPESKTAIIVHLEQRLTSIPDDKPLPTDADVKRFLEDQARSAFTAEVEKIRVDLNSAATLAARALHDALGEIQDSVKRAKPAVMLPVPTVVVDDLTAPPSAAPIVGAVLGGIVGFLAGPAEAGILALLGLFGGLFVSTEQLRRRKIAHLLKVARRDYDHAFAVAGARLSEFIVESADALTHDVEGRGVAFIVDLQLNMRQRSDGLSTQDIAEVKRQLAALDPRRREITRLGEAIRRVSY